MDEDGLVILGDGVNHHEVDPIVHKRMLALVNHFVTTTASFLNHFSTRCEKKLMKVADRLQGLEVTMALLENKLESIEGLGDVTADTYVSSTTAPAQTTVANDQPATPVAQSTAPDAPPPPAAADNQASAEVSASEAQPTAAAAQGAMTNREDPRYKKYFKLIDLGAPPQQIKLRFAQETGFDPNILDNPDGISGAPPPQADSSESEESASDFTDDEDGGAPPAAQQDDSGSEAEFSD
eukprot:TRINITY_DN2134_c0_g1_i1.p1 TRINITY_DN2134_c0_g1~~TRINITY_DN2134_c0_g1_i1.p1  ORF type:complete len:238 (+),score=57.82 TRINITY_DN2134_c0_g1_i1:113-826(+)